MLAPFLSLVRVVRAIRIGSSCLGIRRVCPILLRREFRPCEIREGPEQFGVVGDEHGQVAGWVVGAALRFCRHVTFVTALMQLPKKLAIGITLSREVVKVHVIEPGPYRVHGHGDRAVDDVL